MPYAQRYYRRPPGTLFTRGLYHVGRHMFNSLAYRQRGRPQFLPARFARQGADLAIKAATVGNILSSKNMPPTTRARNADGTFKAKSKSRSRSRSRSTSKHRSRSTRGRRSFIGPMTYQQYLASKQVAKVSSTLDGTFKGKFKVKRKRMKRSMPSPRSFKQGMVIKREGRGVETDANTVFVGQGPNVYLIIKGMVASLMRELFRQAGYTVESFQQQFQDFAVYEHYVDMFWRATPLSTSESSFTYTITGADTIEFIVDAMVGQIQTGFSGAAVHEFTKMRLSYTTPGTGPARISTAFIDLNNFYFMVKMAQNMLIQNQTKGGVADDPDEIELDRDSIYANPLYAITYSTSGNGFYPGWRAPTDASYESFHAGGVTGLISTTAADSLPEEGQEPSTGLFKASSTRRERLEPGTIKNLKLNYTRYLSFQKAMFDLRRFWEASGQTDHTDFGLSQMIAFEKMLKSTDSEFDISVAYETNHTIIVKYHYTPTTRINPVVTNSSGV